MSLQQNHPTLESLYPRARKLQFELKIQLSYLDSQVGSSGETLQTEARQNLSLLQQLLWQLESLIQVHPPEERPSWFQKLSQLKQETESLGATLEQHIFCHNRLAVQLNERESLLNRRHTVHHTKPSHFPNNVSTLDIHGRKFSALRHTGIRIAS
uniref:Uncharacterized protein AlNc14C52G4054 n=1 Tax=Albugo laibachii Nc14 TaxID=890382 RepID=F0WBK9_9STRA|nr:conserved hypothetical protein [Albugo laibachii Nc14]|eukprot:CCA18536.1 conserved hypothetical protein [Albugo laibachii Nc14]